jgi:hypothetical protein
VAVGRGFLKRSVRITRLIIEKSLMNIDTPWIPGMVA